MFSGCAVPASPWARAGGWDLGEEGAPGQGLRGWMEILAQSGDPPGTLTLQSGVSGGSGPASPWGPSETLALAGEANVVNRR